MQNGQQSIEEQKIEEIKGIYKQHGLAEAQDEWPHGVQAAMIWINKYLFDHRLTVGWMKEQCGLKGHNFSGKFRYYVGKSPRQYWLYHKIEAAKLMLKDDILAEVSLADIAYNLGFNNHSTFSKAFKRLERITPGDFKTAQSSRNNSREVSRANSKEM